MICPCKSEWKLIQRVSYIRSGDGSALRIDRRTINLYTRIFTFKRVRTNVYYVQYSWIFGFPDGLVFRTGHSVSVTGSVPSSGYVLQHRHSSVREVEVISITGP